MFRNPTSDQFPNHCNICNTVYEDPGQYCLPDVVFMVGLTRDTLRKGVIFVNGSIHFKRNIAKKDYYQIECLKAQKYRIFVIMNSEIDPMRDMNLKALMKTYVLATTDDELYNLLIRDEKEICNLK